LDLNERALHDDRTPLLDFPCGKRKRYACSLAALQLDLRLPGKRKQHNISHHFFQFVAHKNVTRVKLDALQLHGPHQDVVHVWVYEHFCPRRIRQLNMVSGSLQLGAASLQLGARHQHFMEARRIASVPEHHSLRAAAPHDCIADFGNGQRWFTATPNKYGMLGTNLCARSWGYASSAKLLSKPESAELDTLPTPSSSASCKMSAPSSSAPCRNCRRGWTLPTRSWLNVHPPALLHSAFAKNRHGSSLYLAEIGNERCSFELCANVHFSEPNNNQHTSPV